MVLLLQMSGRHDGRGNAGKTGFSTVRALRTSSREGSQLRITYPMKCAYCAAIRRRFVEQRKSLRVCRRLTSQVVQSHRDPSYRCDIRVMLLRLADQFAHQPVNIHIVDRCDYGMNCGGNPSVRPGSDAWCASVEPGCGSC
jgi:hypothetical protein